MKVLEDRLKTLEKSHGTLKEEAHATIMERDGLRAAFEQTVQQARQRANVGNVLLEQIVTAAGLDAEALGRAHAELEGHLARKNEALRDAKYDRVRAQKAYNDALRTYSQKLVDLGIPSPEIDAMGFTLLPSQSTSGPAGLVVQ